MSWYKKSQVADEANHYSKKYYIDEEKSLAFQDGVKWTLDRFLRMVEDCPYAVQPGTKKLVDKLTLSDFKKLVNHLTD